MLKLDKQRRLKIPADLLEISNLEKFSNKLYIMLKGDEIFLSTSISECFDGILATATLDTKMRFIMPNRVINILKLNESNEVLLYVNKAGYIVVKAAN